MSQVLDEIKEVIKFSSTEIYNDDYLERLKYSDDQFLLVKTYHLKKSLCRLEMSLWIEIFIIFKYFKKTHYMKNNF